ncbi:hypothetical protein HIR71_14910 [Cellulomonas fimi]|uniref:Uncharacterized protein n=1 Tax=Cellulomonas fimi TaxID=1708 RepID=A0A7Y0M0G9_CELFI|nr:hypothetical protein [Cellulomonas fimi]
MSIAAALGVEDIYGPLMTAAREAWQRWVVDDPSLGIVREVVDLPGWLKRSTPADRDVPMATLGALAVGDVDAAVALVWLLVPRAKRIAGKLAVAATDIDALVAGQLWIEIRSGNPPRSYVAVTIMRNVEKAVMAELGIGDAGERADKAWASTSVRDRVEAEPPSRDETPELQRVLRVVLQHLLDAGDIRVDEAKILASVAGKADWLNKPMRGRAGLTSPDVLEVLTWPEPTRARTMRREVGKVLDRVVVAAADLDVLGLLHNTTWNPDVGVCGVPALCPECIRAEFAA